MERYEAKIGDRVMCGTADSEYDAIVTGHDVDGDYYLKQNNGHTTTEFARHCTLIKSNKKTMSSLRTKFKNRFLKEPEKSFLKAGVKDEAGELTEDGDAIFKEWLFNKHAKEFNEEVVQPILEEDVKK